VENAGKLYQIPHVFCQSAGAVEIMPRANLLLEINAMWSPHSVRVDFNRKYRIKFRVKPSDPHMGHGSVGGS
jgi:hypothetical protein